MRATRVLGLWFSLGGAGLALAFHAGSSALGAERIPECPSVGWPTGGVSLPVDNARVLQWKRTTENQYLDRGHVQGRITRVFEERPGHVHFEIQIGDQALDTIEVVYNKSFGGLPSLKAGAQVEACGDYITSTAPSGPYPASPSGAIIHWVHANPKGKGHPPGFVVVEGKVCGQDLDHVGPRWEEHDLEPSGLTPEVEQEQAVQ